MQNSNVRRLLIPAMTAAATVFGITLLILGTQKADWFEQVAKTRNEDLGRDYTLTHRGRDAAIRVVGSAIVLSVATGIVTVELLRKWYAFREEIDQKAEDLGLMNLLSENPASVAALTGEGEAASEPIAEPIEGIALPELQIHQLQWNRPSDLEQSQSQILASQISASPNPASQTPASQEMLSQSAPIALSTALDRIREIPHHEGTTDRPLRSHSLETYYRLDYENHHYRFVRTAPNHAAMMQYMDLLQRHYPMQHPLHSAAHGTSHPQEVLARLNPDGESYSLWVKV